MIIYIHRIGRHTCWHRCGRLQEPQKIVVHTRWRLCARIEEIHPRWHAYGLNQRCGFSGQVHHDWSVIWGMAKQRQISTVSVSYICCRNDLKSGRRRRREFKKSQSQSCFVGFREYNMIQIPCSCSNDNILLGGEPLSCRQYWWYALLVNVFFLYK